MNWLLRSFFYIFAVCSLSAVSLGVATPAFAQQQGCSKGNSGQTVGSLIGAGLGALGGSRLAGKKNRTIGALAGGALGLAVGGALGRALDQCEKQRLNEATVASLDEGADAASSRKQWVSTSRPNVSGTVTAAPAVQQADGRICRTVTRVNYVDGREMTDTPTFCRVPPASAWQPASA